MQYFERVHDARETIDKAISKHGITVTLDALELIAEELADSMYFETADKKRWSDIAAALRVLTHLTVELAHSGGTSLEGR